MTARPWTYERSGVPPLKTGAFVDSLKALASRTPRRGVVAGIGGFSGLFDARAFGFKDPLLVASSDGVGTKLKLAMALGRHGGVGQDLVAMCVNDLLACGARPVFFLDYFATGRFSVPRAQEVLAGVARACRLAGCALLGGETAVMPDFYSNGAYDLAGFAVGLVERKRVIDGRSVRKGDLLLGLAASGPHSNGYSLIRKLVGKKDLRRWGRALLEPTRIYVKPVLAVLERVKVRAIAHITGGAFHDNLPRVLPRGLAAWIDRRSWKSPAVFEFLQRKGKIEDAEMFRTFNMGIGMVLITAPKDVARARLTLKRHGVASRVIGEVVRGRGVLIP